VNNDPPVPSKRTTHLGYHLSHPTEPGDVQAELGIHAASSFVVQVRNPSAPVTGGQRVGRSRNTRADFPDEVMRDVFGQGTKGTDQSIGLRFASVIRPDLLDYEGAELLLIAARAGEDGVEQSLGEGRGEGETKSPGVPLQVTDRGFTALKETEEMEGKESIDQVFKELAMDAEKFPSEALEGEWI
jgi:hypothetical protein